MQKRIAHAFGCFPCQTCRIPLLCLNTRFLPCHPHPVCYGNRRTTCVCVCFFVEVGY